MTLVADTLPDDPGTHATNFVCAEKVMLIAERLRAERLKQIIKELQRHRFGPRAETLPEDQLLLGLEEVEQGVAADEAAEERDAPAAKAKRARRRRANRGSHPAHLPRIETIVDIEDKVFADETTAPVLDPGRGRTKTGQLFAYARDDRPFDGGDTPAVAYVYAPDHKAERPIAHLQGFAGILQLDGYGGYKVLTEKGDVKLAFCWAHVRRRFYELAAAGAGAAPIATEMLERIAALYRVAAEIRGRSAELRRLVGQERTRPILDAIEPFQLAKLQLISQKTKLAEASRYTLPRWEGLCRFADDGRVEIDSNTVERSVRPLALTRKNALFAGSDGGAGHWAIVASLVETCKLNGVDTQAYLTEVITRIVQGHPNREIDELMPWKFKLKNELAAVA